MEVTSIRLERELKDHLKDLADGMGYQALIRNILWTYVNNKNGGFSPNISDSMIVACIDAVALQDLSCYRTGKRIVEGEFMQYVVTNDGVMLPLAVEEDEDI